MVLRGLRQPWTERGFCMTVTSTDRPLVVRPHKVRLIVIPVAVALVVVFIVVGLLLRSGSTGVQFGAVGQGRR